MRLKAKILAITGAISASIGIIVPTLGLFGLCPCTITSIIATVGIASAITGFFIDNGVYFIVAGILLFTSGIILHKRVHKKNENKSIRKDKSHS